MSPNFLRNPLSGLAILAAAAGGPYLWYETEIGKQGRQAVNSATSTFSSYGTGTGDPYSLNPVGSTLGFDGANLNADGTGPVLSKFADPFNPTHRNFEQLPVISLAEVLRFDVTPEWVMGRFPRVSTLLSETQLDGMRAPLITGSTPSDLAGTVTYYFDRYKQLKRITVHATVGDPTRFVAELQQSYQMSQEPSLGGKLYVIKWNGAPTSLLNITPAAVIYNDLPYGRFQLFLELNQAGLEYGLSVESQQLVQAGRNMQRW
jgi:hypothetical protein